MALQSRELYSEVGGPSFKRAKARNIRPVTFAADASATLLNPLTPVAYNTATDFWEPWVSGAANGVGTIRAFIWPEKVQLKAANEVLGTVLLEGEVHVDDIDLSYGVQTVVDLKTAIQTGSPSLRELDIEVQGLAKVR